MPGAVKTFTVLAVVICTFAQDIGDRCFLEDGSVASCKHITLCQTAQAELRKGKRPKLCGFSGNFPVICCDEKDMRASVIERNLSKIEEKCQEITRLNILTTITTTTTTTWKPPPGVFAAIGGIDARSNEFPHMAILGYGPQESIEFRCGGSLISEEFVLTAAHCIESRESGLVSAVRLGDLNIFSETDAAEPQNFRVVQTIPHPDYDYNTFYNDIALLKLDRPAILTTYVTPACIQTKLELGSNDLTATGWGALDFGGSMHSTLQVVKLKNLPTKTCLPTYGPQPRLPRGIDEELQICSGNLEKRMDTCQGDSGGPLQTRIKNYPAVNKIVGITSFGSNCGLVPGVYTRVSRYAEWIESIVWPN